MIAHRAAATVSTVIAAVLTLTACGPSNRSNSQPSTNAATRATETPSRSQQSPVPARGADQEGAMRIVITVGDQRFQATLAESVASDDLLEQLPLTVHMTDHGAVEKTGRLPSPLSLDGQPRGADPDAGDIGYYSPGRDIVLYYGDQSYYEGIVVLGQMLGDAAERLSHLDGPITAIVDTVDD